MCNQLPLIHVKFVEPRLTSIFSISFGKCLYISPTLIDDYHLQVWLKNSFRKLFDLSIAKDSVKLFTIWLILRFRRLISHFSRLAQNTTFSIYFFYLALLLTSSNLRTSLAKFAVLASTSATRYRRLKCYRPSRNHSS